MDRSSAVCIIGSGKCAGTCTAWLMSRGYQVRMWGRDARKMREIAKNGLNAEGVVSGQFFPAAFESLSDAVKGAKFIVVQTTAPGHRPAAEALKGLLEQGQVVLIFNGNWGAYEFYDVLGKEAKEKDVIIAETAAQIFMSDYHDGVYDLKRIKNEAEAAAAPAHNTARLMEEIGEIFPQLKPGENVISTTINSSNPVLHTPITLFNLARADNGEDYMFYLDAASPLVVKAAEKLDRERCLVAEAVGVRPIPVLDIINSFWDDKYDDLRESLRKHYPGSKGPKTLKFRYIEEDLPFGMAAVAVLGKLCGVQTPCLDAMLAAYQWVFDTDFRELAPRFDQEKLKEICR